MLWVAGGMSINKFYNKRLADASSDLTLPYLTMPYLALPYLTLPYLTLPYLTLPYLTLPYLTLNLTNHT